MSTCFAYGMFEGKPLRCQRDPGHDEDHAFVVKWGDSEVIDPTTLIREPIKAALWTQSVPFDSAETPIEADARLALALEEIADDDDDGMDLSPEQLRALATRKEQANHPAKCFSCNHPWHFTECTAPLLHNGQLTEVACGCSTAVA